MKKTITNTVLGGLGSLALMAGVSFADESKGKETPQGGIFADEQKDKETSQVGDLEKEISSKIKEQLKKAGMGDAQIEKLLKNSNHSKGINGQKGKVITRTMVIGPDGNLKDATDGQKNGKKGGIDLGKLLSEVEDGDVKKLLNENKAAITSGKVVIIDADGNRTEKNLEEGGNINDMLKQALSGLGNGPDFKMRFGDAKENVDYKKEINELKEELFAQRVLLEKILKKLD